MRDRISGFLVLGAVLGGIGGVVCLVIGYLDYQIRAAGQDTPREVTAAELYANGPGDNAHIKLKLFALSNNYVYSTDNGRWTGVWLAVYPSELEKNIPPKLILRNTQVTSEAEVAKLVEKEEFEGILMSSVPMHGAGVNTELRQTWPSTDWDHVMMLQDGREYPRAGWVNGMLGGGLCGLILCVICSIGAWLTKK